MKAHSHQRRASSISASPSPQKSFHSDIEKYGDMDEADEKRIKPRSDILGAIITVMIYILCAVTVVNFWLLRSPDNSDGILATFMRPFGGSHGSQPSSEVELIDMKAIGALGDNADDELWKLNDHYRKNSPNVAVAPGQQPPIDDMKPSLDSDAQEALSAVVEPLETINPQGDLLEILSVSPIVILSSNPSSAIQDTDETTEESRDALYHNKLENQVMEIMLGFLHITPEPRVVDLAKHPHHNEIVHYLQSYSMHNSETSEDELDIPRIFIGGQPVANHKQVVEKYYNKDLVEFLRDHGRGIINIE